MKYHVTVEFSACSDFGAYFGLQWLYAAYELWSFVDMLLLTDVHI